VKARGVLRAAASAAVLAGGLALAPPAAAAPVVRVVNTVQDLSCVFETEEGALVFFGASATSMDGEAGSFLFVEDVNGDLVLEGEGGTAAFDGSSVEAQVQVSDVRGEEPVPVGLASVQATRTVVGEPETHQIRERSGNTWTKGTVVVTSYQVTVTSVNVPGYTVRLGDDDCTSEDLAFDVKSTNPRARIYSTSGFESAICALEGLPNGEVRLSGDLRDPIFEVVIDDGVNPLKASGQLRLRGGSDQATVPLIDLTTEQSVAALTIDVDLTKLSGRTQESENVDGITLRTVVVPYRATITVTTSDGRSGVAHCSAVHVKEKIIIRPGADLGE